MINDDGVKLEDVAINITVNGKTIAEVVIDEAQPTPDKQGMRFSTMAKVGSYSIQFSAVRRLTEDEELFYNKEVKQ